MALSLREQMFLSWLDPFGTGEEVYLDAVLTPLDPDYGSPPWETSRTYEERDCYVAGVAMPTKHEALDLLQVLLDRGFVTGWWEGISQVANIRDTQRGPGGTSYELTATGREEAETFRLLVDSEEGRRKTREFGRELVDRETAELGFRVILPTYLPDEIDPLPDLIVRDDEVAINYDGITIEESAGEFEEANDTTEQRIYEERIGDRDIRVAERQHTSISAQLASEWEQQGVHIRLHLNVREPVPTTQAEFKYAVIDDEVREEARKIAHSMIEQSNN